MSIVTEARDRADNALEQGKSTATAVQQRIASMRTEARGRTGEVADETKGLARAVVDRARRQAHVQLGLGDVFVATVAKRSAELPGDVKQVIATLTDATKDRISQANAGAAQAQRRLGSVVGGLIDRGGDAVGAVREISLSDTTVTARDTVDSRVQQAKDAVDKLAQRGEQVASDLRHDPVVARVIGGADTGLETVANQVTSVAQKVRSGAAAQAERENAAVTATPVRPVPASRVPAHTTIARSTPAGEAAVSSTPTHRAAAHEAQVRHEAGVKAAETRKATAQAREEAAQERSATARRAAKTRKQNAEKAADERSAAALKAAATRKENSEARKATARKAARTRKANALLTAAAAPVEESNASTAS